jgi:SPP1 gp7 family putative phage head morphogenesis protein
MAAVDRTIARNLARLLRDEPQMQARLARAYGVARRDIDRRLRDLMRLAEIELAAGRPLNSAWLYQQRATLDLLATVERTVGNFATGPAASAVNTSARGAAWMGADHAVRLLPANATPIGNDVVARIIAASTDGPVRQVLDSLAPRAVGAVNDRLLSGVIAGRPLRRIADDIAGDLNVPLSRTRLIVRTETLRAYRGAQMATYTNHPDVKAWMWVAACDARSCAACWAKHGTRHTGRHFPAHPGCRCTAVPIVGDDDPGIPLGTDLFDAAPPDVQAKVLGPSAKRAYDAGVLGLPDLVGTRPNATWGESVHVRSLRSVLGPDGARRYYR